MIVRLLNTRLGMYLFATTGQKGGPRQTSADLPQIEFPTKPKPEQDEQLPMSVAY
jgi:hypothetical protein